MSKFREQSVGYILTALGLVAGLAWNDSIKALIDTIFPLGNNGLIAKFIYAVGVTLIVVIISGWLVRLTKQDK